MREAVIRLLDGTGKHRVISRAISGFIIGLILLNVLAMILETEPVLTAEYAHVFRWFEWLSVVVFGGEYVVRLWACTALPEYGGTVGGRVRYALRWGMVVDLFAFAPSLLPMLGIDLRVLRVLRILRIARALKLGRYFGAAEFVFGVIARKRHELVASVVCVLVMMVCSATLLYFVERYAQPEHFGSIPRAMWWSVVTLTTVGYGDVHPVTPFGKSLAAVVALLGVGLFALPAGLLSAGFTEQLAEIRGRDNPTA